MYSWAKARARYVTCETNVLPAHFESKESRVRPCHRQGHEPPSDSSQSSNPPRNIAQLGQRHSCSNGGIILPPIDTPRRWMDCYWKRARPQGTGKRRSRNRELLSRRSRHVVVYILMWWNAQEPRKGMVPRCHHCPSGIHETMDRKLHQRK